MAHPTSWGKWTFDEDRLVLMHADVNYEVDVEDCCDCPKTLDWIVQIAEKTWASSTDVGDLVRAINDLIALQSSVCGFGIGKTIENVRDLIEKRRPPLD